MSEIPPQPIAVRRCWRCGEPASVVVRDWGPTSAPFFAKGVTQKDWVCQACGSGFQTRHRWRRLLVGLPLIGFALCGPFGAALTVLDEPSLESLFFFLVISVLGLVFAVIFGAPFAVLALSPLRADAEPPPLRYRFTEPQRRCSCGEASSCVKVIEQRTRGIKTGVDHHYACAHCPRTFVVESVGASVFTMLLSVGLSLAGSVALYYGAYASWLGLGLTALMLLIGVGGIALTISRVVNRFRHPRIQPDGGWEAAI